MGFIEITHYNENTIGFLFKEFIFLFRYAVQHPDYLLSLKAVMEVYRKHQYRGRIFIFSYFNTN